MTKCLYCGLEAIPSEVFCEIQLYECSMKHRTGIIVEAQSNSESSQTEKKNIKCIDNIRFTGYTY